MVILKLILKLVTFYWVISNISVYPVQKHFDQTAMEAAEIIAWGNPEKASYAGLNPSLRFFLEDEMMFAQADNKPIRE